MATMSERVSLIYSGEAALEVGAGANPNPSVVQPGETVEVDEWAAESLLNSGGPWAPVGPAPDGVLTGVDLDDALRAAGLPTTGKAAEKRARLTAYLEDEVTENDPEVDPSSATDDDHTETEA